MTDASPAPAAPPRRRVARARATRRPSTRLPPRSRPTTRMPGQADRAAAYYQRAAEVEQRIGANLEAIALLQPRAGAARGPCRRARTVTPASSACSTVARGLARRDRAATAPTEASAVYARCRQLCQVLGRPPSPPILRALAMISLAQARIDECHALGDHLLSIAERDDDPVLRAEAHFVIGVSLVLNGAARPARAALEASLASYDRSRSPIHIGLYSQDPARRVLDPPQPAAVDHGRAGRGAPGAVTRASSSPPRWATRSRSAIAGTWDADHRVPPWRRGRGPRRRRRRRRRSGRDHRMPFWLSIATAIRGWAIAEAGRGRGRDRGDPARGSPTSRPPAPSFLRPFQLGLLGGAVRPVNGNLERGAHPDRRGTRGLGADGRALVRPGAPPSAAATCTPGRPTTRRPRRPTGRPIDLARYQGARALELRSATRLAASWQRRDRAVDIAPLLAPIVEGLDGTTDLPDLDQARAILRAGSG